MIRTFLSSVGFVFALIIGIVVASMFTDREEASIAEPPATVFVSSSPEQPSTPASDDVEFYNLKPFDLEFPERDELIDVFESEGVYRESEVIAKSGEVWLTLFESGGRYRLEMAKAKVKKLKTKSYPSDENDVRLSFDMPLVPVISLRHSLGLTPGPVTTLYHRPSPAEIQNRNLPIGAMQTGYKQDFNLNNKWYTLRVSRGQTTDRNKVGVLVLEGEGIKQIVTTNYYEPAYGEIIGNLLWVGDLDRDGKLDLYIDTFNEKGAFITSLYLSSKAESGELLKLAAMFSTTKC